LLYKYRWQIELFFKWGQTASAYEIRVYIKIAKGSGWSPSMNTSSRVPVFLISSMRGLKSSLAGLIGFQFGATTTFLTPAIATIIVALYILTIPKACYF